MAMNGGKVLSQLRHRNSGGFQLLRKVWHADRCGDAADRWQRLRAKTMFFGANQAPGRAKLIVIKGEGMDGVTYQLNATEHWPGALEAPSCSPTTP